MRAIRFIILFYYAYQSWKGNVYRFRKIKSFTDIFTFAWKGSTPAVYRIIMKLIHYKTVIVVRTKNVL